MPKDELEWITQKCKTNMNHLIDVIEISVKENGMEDRANELPSMEKDQIVYTFLAITGLSEERIGAVENQIGWAIGIQAPELQYHPTPGNYHQRSCMRLTHYYKMALNKRGIRCRIDEEGRKSRKGKVSKRRKEIREFEKEQ